MPRECNCAGPCDPVSLDLTRREFLTLAGTGTVAALTVGSAWARETEKRAASGALDQWKADLLRNAPKRLYRSETHSDVRFPLGGIGTGSFELGVDGRFTTWHLFNTLRDGSVPLFFAARVGSAAKLLQTRGGPEWPRISGIEMTGEYPIAILRCEDGDLPARIEMTAFSPFAPLDSEISSVPVALFIFRVKNPTRETLAVSLAAFMQNPVGYDAMGVPVSFNSVGFNETGDRLAIHHPNHGRNVNRASRDGNATALHMEAKPGDPATLDRPVTLFTNVNTRGLSTPPDDRPENLAVAGIDRLARASDEPLPDGGSRLRIVWLEDPAADLSLNALRAIRDEVRDGAALVLAGESMPLLDLYGGVTKGQPLETGTVRPDILFEDFESGYDGWTVEGEAFGTTPAVGALPYQQAVTGFEGKGLVNTFLADDTPKGRIVSQTFKIERNYIRFLVGGGSGPKTQVRLLVDGKAVRTKSGADNERLVPASWDVRDLAGREARIEIVDDESGAWGHINADQIEFADLPGSAEVMAILEEMLPARFSGVKKAEDGRVEFDGLTPIPDIRRFRESRTGREVITRSVGRGTVALLDGQLMRPTDAELTGARQQAYAVLCAITGARYDPPNGVPAKFPGFGSLALGVLDPVGTGRGDSVSAAPKSNRAKSDASKIDMEATVLTAFDNWDGAWKRFTEEGRFDPANGRASAETAAGRTVNGAVAANFALKPGESVEIPFFLAWRYPNLYNGGGEWMGTHYSTVWKDTAMLVRETANRYPEWRDRTERFRSVFYDSTLPYWFLDCLTSQISTIRHPGVVFRIANGDAYGWEGSNGCCQPTCTHVWGYEQTLSRLFPDLEREMRRIDYTHQQREDGGINNRTAVPSPPHPTGEQPFSDGHSSGILKAYREALHSPDDAWLREYWPRIRRAVDYLIARDAATSDGTPDGTLSDDQWNTYDNAIHGINSFIGTYYLAALRAGEEMARRMGEPEVADRYHDVFERGSKRLVDLCWNGEYFEQNLPGYLERSGEYGIGCLSDQLIGQWWAHQLDLGYLLPKEMVRKALASIFRYNWLADFSGFQHNWRKFAGGNDRGLLNCTWPKGGRPANTIPYVDEVWTGVEYQVAGHMLYEGMLDEAFAIVKGARDRYDGIPRSPMPRNPWNEIECGGHYVRAMANWTLLHALAGYRFDGMRKQLSIAPIWKPERHRAFFEAPEGWGSISQTRHGRTQRNEIAVAEGRIDLSRVRLETPGGAKIARVTRTEPGRKTGRAMEASLESDGNAVEVVFAEPVSLREGEMLAIVLRS